MQQTSNSKNSLYAQVAQILLKEWDPIGVQNAAEAQDEYVNYIPPICDLISSRKSESDIFDCLWWIETEHMGLRGNEASTKIIAKKLVQLVQANC